MPSPARRVRRRAAHESPHVKHRHHCPKCGTPWICLYGLKTLRDCPVTKAEGTNKQPARCNVCYHLEMLRRFVKARGYLLVHRFVKLARPR